MKTQNKKPEVGNLLSKTTKSPTLSLCMIVKNEEEFLGQCLESVKTLVDEMIIVDTGSEDRTVEIAESYGAKIYHHPWQGSFSEARNVSLQYATCDWILQLDADEALEQEDIPIVRAAIKKEEINAIFVALLNDASGGWAKHYFQRIFRRGKAHYEGIVHNQLVVEGKQAKSEIRVYHFGYNLSHDKMMLKYKRTEELLLRQLEEDPGDPFAHQNYIRNLRAQGRYEEAIVEGRRAFIVASERLSDGQRQMISVDQVYSLIQLGRQAEAVKLCEEMLALNPQNLDVLFFLGQIQLIQKKYEEAVQTYKKFIKVKDLNLPQHHQLIFDTYSLTHQVWSLLSDAYAQLNELEKSHDAALSAIKERPDIPLYKLTLARTLLLEGNGEEAHKLLATTANDPKVEAQYFIKWAQMCGHFPGAGDSIDVLRRGSERFPQSDELWNQLGYGSYPHALNEAEQAWLQAVKNNPNHLGALVGLFRIYNDQHRIDDLKMSIPHFTEICSRTDLLKEVAGYAIQQRLFEDAIHILTKYLSVEPNAFEALSDIATCYAELGRIEAAFEGYKAALTLSPGNHEILMKIRQLQEMASRNQT